MNIEKFYYDEQTEMYEQIKKEQDEHEQSLSVEEREKEHQKLLCLLLCELQSDNSYKEL